MTMQEGPSGRAEPAELTVRVATDADRPAVIDLCRASLEWEANDPNEAFFSWKHDESPFGASPRWVAVTGDGELVGLRVFLRWEFTDAGGSTIRAVRAVDTATHPDWQGRGIFRRLTLGAIPDLADDDVDVIFNTPNDKSRPGYLKMGWSQVGQVPVGVRPSSLGTLPTLLKARSAAELWSEPSDVGISAIEAFADLDALEQLVIRLPAAERIATRRTPEFLKWRYSLEPLRYRVVPLGDNLRDGAAVVRFRRRGAALECAVCDVLAPRGASVRPVINQIAKTSGADYLLRCVGPEGIADGFIPVPRLGPILTWRPVTRFGIPRMSALDLALGDVELF